MANTYMTRPKLIVDISLIIPVHSGVGQLESLFDALLDLRLNNYRAECIFVADKCKKSTFEVIKQRCRLIKPTQWVNWQVVESDFGNPDQARNLGKKYAHGKVIAFIDDDCHPFPGWLVAGLCRIKDHSAVTGPVLHLETVWGKLVAVMDFGEFQSNKAKNMNNAPGCNIFVFSEILACYPMVSGYSYGGDRLLVHSVSIGKKKIGYYPDIAVFHHPPLNPSAIWNREIRYGKVAWATRKIDPSLPWGSLLNIGFAAVFLMTLGRFFIDLKRLWHGDQFIPYKIIISFMLFPFRIAYLKGLTQSYIKYGTP